MTLRPLTRTELGSLARADGRLLIVCLDNLGDLVFASALAPPLRARFPHARITVWSKAYTAEIASLIPGVTDVVASDPFWDRAPGYPKGPVLPFLHTGHTLRRTSFDIALLAFAPWRTAAAVAATGVPVRIGTTRRRNRPFLTYTLPPEERTTPVLTGLARLLEPFGIVTPDLRYRLDTAPLAARRAHLEQTLGGIPIAVLHAFASKRNRCVDPTQWRSVATALEDRGFAPLWIGSTVELTELRAGTHSPDRWLYGDRVLGGSLSEMAAALSAARLFVGHDSGPLHIAGAFGVPSVAVFAPGEPHRTFPQGVGPSRILARASPSEIIARDIIAEVDALTAR